MCALAAHSAVNDEAPLSPESVDTARRLFSVADGAVALGGDELQAGDGGGHPSPADGAAPPPSTAADEAEHGRGEVHALTASPLLLRQHARVALHLLPFFPSNRHGVVVTSAVLNLLCLPLLNIRPGYLIRRSWPARARTPA